MQDLTFGEQVKIILGRKGMTIKQLAELIEEKTGKKMSRQNLTQRLGRDNFQEQDMRMIAEMLECPFHLSIMSAEGAGEVRSIAALARAAAARVEAVEASGHKELTAKEQAEAEYAEPEEKLIEETVPEMFEHTEEFAQNKAEAEYIEPEEPVEAEYIQTEEPVEAEYIQTEEPVEAEYIQPEEPVEAEYIQPEESVEAEYIQPEKEADMSMPDTEGLETPGEEVSNDRDMTIGELYEIHEELNELEKNVQAGESIEEIKKELEKPKKERRLGSFFRRRDTQSKAEKEVSPKENEVQTDAVGESGIGENVNQNDTDHADKAGAVVQDESVSSDAKWTEDAAEDETAFAESGSTEDFEPVITHDDADEDTQAGDVNPYTGKEYQSNSVRMHPTRIGYVQVYDRTIHKWTDMTEWAFLGLQERKKALLGKAYEPPIYLD